MQLQTILLSAIVVLICVLVGLSVKISLLQKTNNLLENEKIMLRVSLTDSLARIQTQNKAIKEMEINLQAVQIQKEELKTSYEENLTQALQQQNIKLESPQDTKEELKALYTLLRVAHASN